jgi:hypothetical protein
MSRRHDRCRPDRVERYLRRLARWAPRKSRHDLVMEASCHLYEATRRGEEAGLTHEAAQRAAVHAFGPAWRIGLAERGLRVAQVVRRAQRPRPRPRLY